MENFTVPEGQNGKKLSKCVTAVLPALKGGDVRELLKKGDIKLNGARIRRDVEIAAGDEVVLYLPADKETLPEIEIAYEDANIIIVNKMPGISVLSDKDDGRPALIDLVKKHMEETNCYIPETGNIPNACHRLDHNTGGLTMFTKNGEIYDNIIEAMKQRRIVKFYRAVVAGQPTESGELKGFLLKDASASRVRIVNRMSGGAKPIVTRYKVIKRGETAALVEIELVTGRTHQIRAHMASIKTPVLGDDKYGDRRANKRAGLKYQALWATKIVFHTGANNVLAYLNGLTVEAKTVMLPSVR